MSKVSWSGRLISVQLRIRLVRSFDERHHSYLGYVLRINGICGDENDEFLIAIGNVALEKHGFQRSMELRGLSMSVPDLRLETVGFYKTSGFKIMKDAESEPSAGPPFHGVPPDLETYRSRGTSSSGYSGL